MNFHLLYKVHCNSFPPHVSWFKTSFVSLNMWNQYAFAHGSGINFHGDFFTSWPSASGRGKVPCHFPCPMIVCFSSISFHWGWSHWWFWPVGFSFMLSYSSMPKASSLFWYVLSFKLKLVAIRSYLRPPQYLLHTHLQDFRPIFTSTAGHLSFFLVSPFFCFSLLFLEGDAFNFLG